MKKLNRINAGVVATHPVKVIQFGGGNFLRGFADWMIDVMNEKVSFDGSIQIVLSVNKEMTRTVREQNGLYHVVVNGLSNGKPFRQVRCITAVAGALDPTENYNEFLQASLNPALEFIISNTTEAGITFNESDTAQSIPLTFPGKLTRFLAHRFENYKATSRKIIVLPCELIQSNGKELREVILHYARYWNLPIAFDKWISDNIIFCNTLVDRIVPGPPKENYIELQEEIGYDDKLITAAEPFHFWGIQPYSDREEDFQYVKKSFPADTAGLDVVFVRDLTPYHTRKVRILNGAHTALTPVALLSGERFVRESVEDVKLGMFLHQAIYEEILPGLEMEKASLLQFANDVLDRFKNPYIKHELSSIALNSVSKFKVRVLPSIIRYYETNKRLPSHLMFSWAALICLYKGEWRGRPTPLNDAPDIVRFFRETWKTPDASAIARKVLSNQGLWGYDLALITDLHASLSKNISDILLQENAGNTMLTLPGTGQKSEVA